MHALRPRELLDLWECCRDQHPVDRALTLLGALYPESSRRELAAWCLGDRDSALLALQRDTFGDTLRATGSCPSCGQVVELEVSLADLTDRQGPGEARSGQLELDGGVVTFRLPNSFDLAAVIALGDADAASAELARRCTDAAVAELSERDVATLEDSIEACDPRTETLFHLTCPECEQAWSEALDVPGFVWSHLAVHAERLMWQVDRLAAAYGWTENEVLALSPARRQWYVEATS